MRVSERESTRGAPDAKFHECMYCIIRRDDGRLSRCRSAPYPARIVAGVKLGVACRTAPHRQHQQISK